MLSFTLDTNCIIAVQNDERDAHAIRFLADAHDKEIANVALVAISASERQPDGIPLESLGIFKERIATLGLDRLEMLEPLCYLDITFSDACLPGDDAMEALEEKIQRILFPKIESSWQKFCGKRDLDPATDTNLQTWKNPKCDVISFWCHAFRERDVFVTSDRNFHSATKKAKLIELAGGRIELPEAAVQLLRAESIR